MYNSIYQRTEILIGKDNVKKLNNSHIVICGIGGVGSYVLEALARVGIGKLTIIDKDIVDTANINRQIIATLNTVGEDKVEVAKKRVSKINDKIEVTAIKENITKENINSLFDSGDIDYVVDSVDNIEAKIAIIEHCYNNKIKCISCMGMGNKLNPLDIRVGDIFKTTMCPLARIVRKELKQKNIRKQKVVYSIEQPKKMNDYEKDIYGNTLGSIAFVPASAGLVIASEVVKDLIF